MFIFEENPPKKRTFKNMINPEENLLEESKKRKKDSPENTGAFGMPKPKDINAGFNTIPFEDRVAVCNPPRKRRRLMAMSNDDYIDDIAHAEDDGIDEDDFIQLPIIDDDDDMVNDETMDFVNNNPSFYNRINSIINDEEMKDVLSSSQDERIRSLLYDASGKFMYPEACLHAIQKFIVGANFFFGFTSTRQGQRIVNLLRLITETLDTNRKNKKKKNNSKTVFLVPSRSSLVSVSGQAFTFTSWTFISPNVKSVDERMLDERLLRNVILSMKPIWKRLRQVKTLVITGAMRISSVRFDMLDLMMQKARDNSDPFGGVCLVVCSSIFSGNMRRRNIFLSENFKKYFDHNVVMSDMDTNESVGRVKYHKRAISWSQKSVDMPSQRHLDLVRFLFTGKQEKIDFVSVLKEHSRNPIPEWCDKVTKDRFSRHPTHDDEKSSDDFEVEDINNVEIWLPIITSDDMSNLINTRRIALLFDDQDNTGHDFCMGIDLLNTKKTSKSIVQELKTVSETEEFQKKIATECQFNRHLKLFLKMQVATTIDMDGVRAGTVSKIINFDEASGFCPVIKFAIGWNNDHTDRMYMEKTIMHSTVQVPNSRFGVLNVTQLPLIPAWAIPNSFVPHMWIGDAFVDMHTLMKKKECLASVFGAFSSLKNIVFVDFDVDLFKDNYTENTVRQNNLVTQFIAESNLNRVTNDAIMSASMIRNEEEEEEEDEDDDENQNQDINNGENPNPILKKSDIPNPMDDSESEAEEERDDDDK